MHPHRLKSLWRGFLVTPAPLPRRLWGLVLALLPLPVRRLLLRWQNRSYPGWLRRLARDLGGYLVVCAGAALVLWLLAGLGPWLCASLLVVCMSR